MQVSRKHHVWVKVRARRAGASLCRRRRNLVQLALTNAMAPGFTPLIELDQVVFVITAPARRTLTRTASTHPTVASRPTGRGARERCSAARGLTRR